jgi:hypothetical protein
MPYDEGWEYVIPGYRHECTFLLCLYPAQHIEFFNLWFIQLGSSESLYYLL